MADSGPSPTTIRAIFASRPTSSSRSAAVPLVPSSDKEEPIGYLPGRAETRWPDPKPRRTKSAQGSVRSPIAPRAIRTVIKREARERQVGDLITANTRRIEELEAMLAASPIKASGRQPPRRA